MTRGDGAETKRKLVNGESPEWKVSPLAMMMRESGGGGGKGKERRGEKKEKKKKKRNTQNAGPDRIGWDGKQGRQKSEPQTGKDGAF